MAYYSKIAEVNERGELCGDETTNSEHSVTTDEDEETLKEMNTKKEDVDAALADLETDMKTD